MEIHAGITVTAVLYRRRISSTDVHAGSESSDKKAQMCNSSVWTPVYGRSLQPQRQTISWGRPSVFESKNTPVFSSFFLNFDKCWLAYFLQPMPYFPPHLKCVTPLIFANSIFQILLVTLILYLADGWEFSLRTRTYSRQSRRKVPRMIVMRQLRQKREALRKSVCCGRRRLSTSLWRCPTARILEYQLRRMDLIFVDPEVKRNGEHTLVTCFWLSGYCLSRMKSLESSLSSSNTALQHVRLSIFWNRRRPRSFQQTGDRPQTQAIWTWLTTKFREKCSNGSAGRKFVMSTNYWSSVWSISGTAWGSDVTDQWRKPIRLHVCIRALQKRTFHSFIHSFIHLFAQNDKYK